MAIITHALCLFIGAFIGFLAMCILRVSDEDNCDMYDDDGK